MNHFSLRSFYQFQVLAILLTEYLLIMFFVFMIAVMVLTTNIDLSIIGFFFNGILELTGTYILVRRCHITSREVNDISKVDVVS